MYRPKKNRLHHQKKKSVAVAMVPSISSFSPNCGSWPSRSSLGEADEKARVDADELKDLGLGVYHNIHIGASS